MISVMEDFEIVRKSAASVTAAADLSFFGTEKSQEGVLVSDGGYGGVSSQRIFSVVDSAEKMPDLVVRVSGVGAKRGSGLPDEKAKLENYVGDDDMLSPVDESSPLMHGYRVGDMVWGKVKSHPWWPGHIFNEAFASPSVRRMRGNGLVLVAFFGDSSYGWFDPAELIPFEPNFPEKSRQTTSRNFVRAVEEAVDEASRRSALAVACRCRNRQNFRPTAVSGYFHVDVVGYEPGGLYSTIQINEARDNFVPLELLSFVNQLALGSHGNNGNTVEWIQAVAKLVAYRRSVFEEFDDTYAQAFGVEPMRPSYNSVGGLDQTGRFAPRVAPLCGQLVVAEVLGERRSSTRLASHKSAKNSKKNKYVLKRREDLPAAASNALPGLPLASQPPHHAFLQSLPDSGGELPVARLESNYFLQKREAQPPFSAIAADVSGEGKPGSGVLLPPDYSQKSEPVEIKTDRESSEPMVRAVPVESFQERDGMDAVMEKVSKRAPEDLGDSGEAKKKRKKKKKKDGLVADQLAGSGYADDHRRVVAGRSVGVGHGRIGDLVSQEDGVNMELPAGLDLSSMPLSRLLSDLSSIALDPFYGDDEDAPAIVRHVFLRFRSLVYQKSLILGSGEQPTPAHASAGRDERGQREPLSTSNSQKQSSKLGDVIKPVRKRDPSDRQEELSVKKMKKMNQLKQLASKKRAAMNQNNSNLQQRTKDHKETAPAAATTEATRKPELPPAPKLPSPTFLIMKFPPSSILPSATNLKARFARFGPLDPSATRVFWRTYTCKVLFKYKSDAQSALDFVKNNDLFGQIKVYYYLRDLEVSVPDQPPDSLNRPSDKDPLQYRHGNAGVHIPSSSQLRQNQMQLKSILKKPVGDDSYNPNSATAAASGAIVREIPRVKFMLKDDEDPPLKLVTSNTNGGGQVPFDQIGRQASKSIPFALPPLPPPPQLLQPHRIPLSAPATMQQTFGPPAAALQPQPRIPQPGVPMHRPMGPPGIVTERSNADISGPMLSLLLKCNDIVGRVKSSLGYTPYHTL